MLTLLTKIITIFPEARTNVQSQSSQNSYSQFGVYKYLRHIIMKPVQQYVDYRIASSSSPWRPTWTSPPTPRELIKDWNENDNAKMIYIRERIAGDPSLAVYYATFGITAWEDFMVKVDFYLCYPFSFLPSALFYLMAYILSVMYTWRLEMFIIFFGIGSWLIFPTHWIKPSTWISTFLNSITWLKLHFRKSQNRGYKPVPCHRTTAKFEYPTSLASEEQRIRLLTIKPGRRNSTPIECSLSSGDDLSSSLNFEALSYAWGDIQDSNEIICNDKSFLIGRNLFQALNNFRLENQERIIWVDAICIDQLNLVEKKHQIPLMPIIYQECNRVLVWLGEDPEYDNTAAALIEKIQIQVIHPGNHLSPEFIKDIRTDVYEVLERTGLPYLMSNEWEGLCRILNNSYWERMWIIQEVLLGSSLVVHFGQHQFSYNELLDAYRTLFILRIPGLPSTNQGIPLLQDLRQNGAANRRLSLGNLITRSHSFVATKPHDKLFALYGLTEDPKTGGISVAIDYRESEDKLFRKAAMSILRKSNTLFVLGIATKVVAPNSKLESWVPDLGQSFVANMLPPIDDNSLLSPAIRDFTGQKYHYDCLEYSEGWKLRIDGVIQKEAIKECGILSRHDMNNSIKRPTRSQMGSSSAKSTRIYSTWISMALKGYSGQKRESRMRELFLTLQVDLESHEAPATFEQFQQWVKVYRIKGAIGKLRLYWIHWVINELFCFIVLSIFALCGWVDLRLQNALQLPYCHNRRLCITTGGHLVFAPARTQKNDYIAIVRGWHHPFILRPASDKAHISDQILVFVGDAWIPHLSKFARTDPEQTIWLGKSGITLSA